MKYKVTRIEGFTLAGDMEGKPFVRVINTENGMQLERASFDDFPDAPMKDVDTGQQGKDLSFVVGIEDIQDDDQHVMADVRSVRTSDRNFKP